MRHPASLPFRVTLASLPLLLLAACGPSEQEKRLQALAGTYVHETDVGSTANPGQSFVHERRALTLKADGTWRLARTVEINGVPDASSSGADSGRFGVNGSTLNVHSEESGMMQYTASGDTLWARNARQAAIAKAVTSIDMKIEDNFLVRER